ncbi:MAG: hypothetical protein K8I65_09100, partial [Thermoanaerobaculia bacterium]|nr:hypothetical protein [Thermoanaerobaculia bacterium]
FADGIDDDSGGDVTGVTAGAGLSGGGASGNVTVAVDFAQAQSRVTGTCAAGSSIRLVAADGTVTCETDDDSGGDVTGVTAGTGLSGGGTSGNVTVAANFAGSGSASTLARSDHNHAGQTWVGTWGLQMQAQGSSVYGLRGWSLATSGQGTGVEGQSDSTDGRGVEAEATATTGNGLGLLALARSTGGYGVYAYATATSGTTYGLYGAVDSPAGRGVYGRATGGGYAGYFFGNASVTGTLSKGGGSFKIDHPLDPERKYLYHSFVESPDMMNVYNGNVVLDAAGEAWIELPEWFEALNRDFRYQLTPIGRAAMVWVAREVEGNRFQIRGAPATKVSWQVTGIRHDPFAEKNRIPVEQEKPETERGLYLHPEAWGRPAQEGIDERESARARALLAPAPQEEQP